MGCGAVPKDSVIESDRPYTRPDVNNNRQSVHGKIPTKSSNGQINGYNRNNNNNINNNNSTGFKKVDIKYSNEYLQDKNKPPKQSSNNKQSIPTTQNSKVSVPQNTNSTENRGSAGGPIKPTSNGKPANVPVPNNNNSKNQGNNTNDKSKTKQNEVKKDAKPPLPPPAPVSKAVAFEITFDNDTNKANIEEILKNKPPRSRFQLSPLVSRPKITQKEIDEKMRLVEMKREQILAEKIKQSQATTIKQDTIKQRQSQETEYSMNKYGSQIDSASRQREAKLDEIKGKQRKQEDKRQKIIQDRRSMANQEIDDLRYNNLEKDQYYNRDYEYF